MFQDHYYKIKMEFINDQFLIQNIENLLVSALNSIDEKEISNNINYQRLWSNYSKLIGPYSTKEIQRVCIKFISEFYSNNSIVVSSVLIGLISAYTAQASYWKKEDKIDFIKRVALPVFCIFSSNPKIADSAQIIITASNFYSAPKYFALFLKVLYCLSSEKPGLPFYSRSLISNFSTQIKMVPFRFFNSIDVFIDKYFNSFMCNLSEYSLNEVENMMKLFFCLFSSCSFLDKKSPLYSNEIELKMNSVLDVFDKFLSLKIEDDNSIMKKNFIHALSFSLVFFEISSYDACISIFPLFMKHIHKILSLLNSTNVNEEELFLASTGLLIESRIFHTNTEIELNFITLLIKEMMNLSLPMQVALLMNVDNVIERNIFNIPKTDYPKYEEILLNYANFAQMKNLGNELRLMIAKILGIFEIRKNHKDLYDSCNEADDDDVMIAASIILNSFLFDQGDERVTKAFNLMSEKCNSKKSTNYEFFKSVSKRFTRRHVDHVLNEVEDLIIQCLGIFAPSYIC